MKKGSTQQEDLIFLETFAPNIGTLKYIRQILRSLRWETQKIAGDLMPPFLQLADHPDINWIQSDHKKYIKADGFNKYTNNI